AAVTDGCSTAVARRRKRRNGGNFLRSCQRTIKVHLAQRCIKKNAAENVPHASGKSPDRRQHEVSVMSSDRRVSSVSFGPVRRWPGSSHRCNRGYGLEIR